MLGDWGTRPPATEAKTGQTLWGKPPHKQGRDTTDLVGQAAAQTFEGVETCQHVAARRVAEVRAVYYGPPTRTSEAGSLLCNTRKGALEKTRAGSRLRDGASQVPWVSGPLRGNTVSLPWQ